MSWRRASGSSWQRGVLQGLEAAARASAVFCPQLTSPWNAVRRTLIDALAAFNGSQGHHIMLPPLSEQVLYRWQQRMLPGGRGPARLRHAAGDTRGRFASTIEIEIEIGTPSGRA